MDQNDRRSLDAWKCLEQFFDKKLARHFGIKPEEANRYIEQHPLPPDQLRKDADRQQRQLDVYRQQYA